MLEAISKRRVIVNVFGALGARLVNITFVLWMYQYLLARIPAEEFAIYPVLVVIMAATPLFVSFYASAVSRSAIEAYAEGRAGDVTVLHTTVVLSLAAAVLVLLGIGALGAATIEALLRIPDGMLGDARLMVLLMTADVALALLTVPFTIAFEVRQRFVARDAIVTAIEFLKIAFALGLLIGLGPRVLWVVVATVAANVVGLAVIAVVARRLLPEFRIRPRLFCRNALRRVVTFGAWTALGQLTMIVYQNGPAILLNLFATPVQVTSYFIGTILERRLRGTVAAALGPLQPVLTTMSVTDDRRRLGNTYLRGGRYALWSGLAIAVPFAVFAEEVVRLYVGETYLEAAHVMTLMLAPIAISYANIMISRVAIATARIRTFFGGAIVMSLSAMAAAWVAVGPLDLGASGVAGAIAATMVVANLVFFWPLGLRLAGVRMGDFLAKTLLPGLLPSAVALLVWLPAKIWIAPAGWLTLAAVGAAGGLVYVATLVLFCLQPDERAARARLLARVRPGGRAPSGETTPFAAPVLGLAVEAPVGADRAGRDEVGA